MSGIPWTRSATANAWILRGYRAATSARATLAAAGGRWAGEGAPCAPPAPFSKGEGSKAGGVAPRFLVKIKSGARRAAWRGRVVVGRAALVAADVLSAVVSDGW